MTRDILLPCYLQPDLQCSAYRSMFISHASNSYYSRYSKLVCLQAKSARIMAAHQRSCLDVLPANCRYRKDCLIEGLSWHGIASLPFSSASRLKFVACSLLLAPTSLSPSSSLASSSYIGETPSNPCDHLQVPTPHHPSLHHSSSQSNHNARLSSHSIL